MTTTPTRDVLNRLGMTGLAVSDADRLAWAASGESHARGVVPAAALAFSALAASGFVDVPFASVSAQALGRLDAAVSSPGTRTCTACPRGADSRITCACRRDGAPRTSPTCPTRTLAPCMSTSRPRRRCSCAVAPTP